MVFLRLHRCSEFYSNWSCETATFTIKHCMMISLLRWSDRWWQSVKILFRIHFLLKDDGSWTCPGQNLKFWLWLYQLCSNHLLQNETYKLLLYFPCERLLTSLDKARGWLFLCPDVLSFKKKEEKKRKKNYSQSY